MSVERHLAPADVRVPPLYARDVRQIDHEALVAPEKALIPQRVRHLAELTVYAYVARTRVIDQEVIHDLYIIDVVGRQSSHVAFRAHEYLAAAQSVALAHGLVHEHGQREIVHGLDHESHGVHVVAAYRVARHVGHERYADLVVRRAQLLRRFHAVQIGHFDVHEHDVALARRHGEESQTVAVRPYFQIRAAFFSVPSDERAQLFRRRGVVFHYRHPYHPVLLPTLRI